MKITCYCPPTFQEGMTTASGKPVRYGICASSKERIGGAYLIWVYDEETKSHQGEFLGYFESADTGGTDGIKNNYVLDVFTPSHDQAVEIMAKTNGKIIVQFIPAEDIEQKGEET